MFPNEKCMMARNAAFEKRHTKPRETKCYELDDSALAGQDCDIAGIHWKDFQQTDVL